MIISDMMTPEDLRRAFSECYDGIDDFIEMWLWDHVIDLNVEEFIALLINRNLLAILHELQQKN